MSQNPFGHDVDRLRVSEASTSRVQSAQENTTLSEPVPDDVEQAIFGSTLPNYVYKELKHGRYAQDIRNELVDKGYTSVDKGYTPEYADDLIAEVQRLYPAARAQEKAIWKEEGRAKRKVERGHWWKTILTGIAVFVLGFVVSGVSYQLSGSDGSYIIAAGAFLGGTFLVLKGLYHRLRWW